MNFKEYLGDIFIEKLDVERVAGGYQL